MTLKYDDMVRGAARLRRHCAEEREAPGCLQFCLVPAFAAVALFVMIAIAPSPTVTWIALAAIILGAALWQTAVIRGAARARRRAQQELEAKAEELGFAIAVNRFGRRFAVPRGAVALELHAQRAHPREAPLLRCRYCGKYIEPGDLVKTCTACEQTYHADCMVGEKCLLCAPQMRKSTWTEAGAHEDSDGRIMLDAAYVREHYVEHGTALEPPPVSERAAIDGTDRIDIDEFR